MPTAPKFDLEDVNVFAYELKRVLRLQVESLESECMLYCENKASVVMGQHLVGRLQDTYIPALNFVLRALHELEEKTDDTKEA